jgi:hypothetical protein
MIVEFNPNEDGNFGEVHVNEQGQLHNFRKYWSLLVKEKEYFRNLCEPFFIASLSSAILCKGCNKPCNDTPYIHAKGINHLWHIECARKVLNEWEIKSMPDTELSKENDRLTQWCIKNANRIKELERVQGKEEK